MKKSIISALAVLAAGTLALHGADVKETWEKNCQKCHGPDGAGKTKMGEKLSIKDWSDPKNQATLKDEEMTKAIKEGVKDGEKVKMKGFGETLNDEDVKSLIAYFRSLKK